MSTRRRARTILFWIGAVLSVCMMSASLGYIQSIILAIGSSAFQQYYSITSIQFNVLLLICALPNLVFPYLTGVMTDLSLGVRWSISLSMVVFIVGQFVWNLSGDLSTPSFHTALVGALILGIALGSMWTVQLYLTASWFAGRCFAFAMSLVVISCLMTTFITRSLVESSSININNALYVGSGVVALCLLCVVVQLVLLKKFPKKRASPRDTLLPKRFQFINVVGTNVLIFLLFSMRYFWLNAFDALLEVQYSDVDSDDLGVFTSIFFVIFLGCLIGAAFLVDHYGYHLLWIQIGSIIFCVGMVSLVWFPFLTLWVNMLICGFGYAFCVLPVLSQGPILHRKKFWSQGFSLNIISITAARLFTGGLILWFEHASIDSMNTMYICVGFSTLCVVVVSFLNLYDFHNSFIMNKSNSEWIELLWDPLTSHSTTS